ncbi:MAG TPA: efflux RND transporter periplasmic adaptor subunit [bacterium]|nr:efflux RND transporter periplasmic adaptor subunit [bacterium]
MKKRWLILVVIFLAVAAGAYAFISSRNKENPQGPQVETYTVTRGDLIVSASGSGILEARETVDITSEIGGTVTWVVEEGSKVKKGDLLCKIDPHDYEVALSRAELNYKNAVLKLDQTRLNLEEQKKQLQKNLQDAKISRDNAYIEYQRAKRQLDNSETLYKSNAVSLSELQTDRDNYNKALNAYNQAVENLRLIESSMSNQIARLEKDVSLAELSVEQVKIDLDNAKLNLSKTVITAPIDGIVANVSVKKGGQNIAKETKLMSILNTNVMRVSLEIDEVDIPKVSLGLPVRVTCEAFGDREFEGEVSLISPTARISNNIAIFDVRVDIPNPTGELRAGMTAEGEIILREDYNVLLVPIKAVRRTGGKAYVSVLNDNGEIEVREVILGEDDGVDIVVKSGLQEGDKIVTSAITSSSGTPGPTPGGPVIRFGR